MTAKFHRTLTLAACLFFGVSSFSAESPPKKIGDGQAIKTDKAAIISLVSKYFAALYASNTKAILQLYSDDGVFLQPFRPTAVGKAAIQQAYDRVFQNDVVAGTFQIAEVVQIASDWAFARANSEGPLAIKATGVKLDGAAQELFILKKDNDGAWKIARFSFSPSVAQRPPPAARGTATTTRSWS